MTANATTFRKGDDRAWRAPLVHGARSQTLLRANRRTAEKAVARELREGKRRYWARQAARLEFAVSCYVQFFERAGGVLTERGTLRKPAEMHLRTEMLLMAVYRAIENRQGEDDRESLAALFRGSQP